MIKKFCNKCGIEITDFNKIVKLNITYPKYEEDSIFITFECCILCVDELLIKDGDYIVLRKKYEVD